MLGFLCNGIPKIGIVFHATLNILYYAISGKGAFMIQNEKKTQIFCKDSELGDCIGTLNQKNEEKIENIYSKLGISKFNNIGSMGKY
jgi:3'-phosphoadenosine 5'-phosphosulfate (PAPS) 3'-phosphatase